MVYNYFGNYIHNITIKFGGFKKMIIQSQIMFYYSIGMFLFCIVSLFMGVIICNLPQIKWETVVHIFNTIKCYRPKFRSNITLYGVQNLHEKFFGIIWETLNIFI